MVAFGCGLEIDPDHVFITGIAYGYYFQTARKFNLNDGTKTNLEDIPTGVFNPGCGRVEISTGLKLLVAGGIIHRKVLFVSDSFFLKQWVSPNVCRVNFEMLDELLLRLFFSLLKVG